MLHEAVVRDFVINWYMRRYLKELKKNLFRYWDKVSGQRKKVQSPWENIILSMFQTKKETSVVRAESDGKMVADGHGLRGIKKQDHWKF